MRAVLALPLFLALVSREDDKAVAAATDYLVRTQDKDGSWECLPRPMPGGFEGFKMPSATRVFATSLCGWALLEHGATPDGTSPASRALTKARDYVIEYLCVGQKNSLANPTWLFSMGGLFLSRVHRKSPTEQGEKALRAALEGLEEFVETTGYWGHGRVDRPALKLSVGYNDLSSSHNWVGIALSEISAAKVPVPERMKKRAVEYYSKVQFTGGGLAYNVEGRSSNKDETSTLGEGRSVTALLTLRRLAPKSEECAASERYAKANLGGILTHHTPWLHLLGAGMAMDETGNRPSFDRLYKARFLAQQDADGSAKPWNEARPDEKRTFENFKSMADKDGQIGRAYTTACFLLLLKPSRSTRSELRPDTPSGDGKKR